MFDLERSNEEQEKQIKKSRKAEGKQHDPGCFM